MNFPKGIENCIRTPELEENDAINKILAEELATAKLDILDHSDDLLILIQD